MKPVFAPVLTIPDGTINIDFYINGLGATEVMRITNDDGSLHVVEFSLDGTIFHLHQEGRGKFDPKTLKGVSCEIGLFVDDVHAFTDRAVAHGATLVSPVQDFDYGYRQGEFDDPLGHRWQIQKRI